MEWFLSKHPKSSLSLLSLNLFCKTEEVNIELSFSPLMTILYHLYQTFFQTSHLDTIEPDG